MDPYIAENRGRRRGVKAPTAPSSSRTSNNNVGGDEGTDKHMYKSEEEGANSPTNRSTMQRAPILDRDGDTNPKLPLLASKASLVGRANFDKKLLLPKMSRTAPAAGGPSRPNKLTYKLYPGNNSRVILMALHKRPWWHGIKIHDVNMNSGDCGSSGGSVDEGSASEEPAPQFIWEMYRNPCRYRTDKYANTIINHIENNNCLVSKKGLYYCIKEYCTKASIDPCEIIPKSFYLTSKADSMKDDRVEFQEYNDNLRRRSGATTLAATSAVVEATSTSISSSSSIKSLDNSNSNPSIIALVETATEEKEGGSAEATTTHIIKEDSDNNNNNNNNNNDNSNNNINSNNNSNNNNNSNSNDNNNSNSNSNSNSNDNNNETEEIKTLNNGEKISISPSGPENDKSDPAENTIWILKPASRTNRGYGIKCVTGLSEALAVIQGKGLENKSADEGGGSKSKNTSGSSSPTEEGGKAAGATAANKIRSSWSSAALDRDADEDKSKDKDGAKGRQFLHKQADQIAGQNGWVVQLYMDRPLLVAGRKFDIRCYCLITLFGKGKLKAYFFRDMYVRTSSKKYSLKNIYDREAHLTNDAVQKHSKNYGKFENGNKLTMDELQESISRDYSGVSPKIVQERIIPEIKRLTKLSITAGAEQLQESKINRSFELLGYDYMIDDQFRPVLIEINSNPCLEFVNPYLEELISSLISNTITKALDTTIGIPSAKTRSENTQKAIDLIQEEENRFQQIYPDNGEV